jgi:hypothetical protein
MLESLIVNARSSSAAARTATARDTGVMATR